MAKYLKYVPNELISVLPLLRDKTTTLELELRLCFSHQIFNVCLRCLLATRINNSYYLLLSLTGGYCHHTSLNTKDFGNFPTVRNARTVGILSCPRTHTHGRAPPLPFSLERASRAIARQYCVRSGLVAPACIQWETFLPPHSLMKSGKKRIWLCGCRSLHPLLVAWGSNLVGWETPALQNTIYCIINGWVSSCEHRPLTQVMIGRLIISSCDSIVIPFSVDWMA